MAQKITQKSRGGSTKKPPTKKSSKSLPARSALLITGAGSGIGLAFTEDCLTPHKVWGDYEVVVMVARDPQKLKQTASRLREQWGNSPEILTLAVDLSQPESKKTVMSFISRNRLRLVGLINNAGVGHFGEFASMSPEKIREIINLNIFSLTELTHAVLTHMEEWMDTPPPTNPFILNVASVVGLIPFPLTAVYAASKAYVVSFSEALRLECEEEIQRRGYGVEVYTLCPGSTRTDFFERAGKPIFSEDRSRGLLSLNSFMDPVQVVEETRKAISEKKPFIIPGTTNRFIPLLARLLPRKGTMQIAHRFMKGRLKK